MELYRAAASEGVARRGFGDTRFVPIFANFRRARLDVSYG